MKFLSTRHKTTPTDLSLALTQGLAPDGGLFIPETLPSIDLSLFSSSMPYEVFVKTLLNPFFESDQLQPYLQHLCDEAFSFPAPLVSLEKNTHVLELFHGPTLSFKDFGARFLGEALHQMNPHSSPMKTILVATSGDTGSAVASAFYGKPGYRVVILYPENQISERQAHQITCWDKNIFSFAVQGNFDTCQALVKSAFSSPEWQQHEILSSANSINIGRLLPQMGYYAFTSFHFYETHQCAPNFIVPTGNLGNATAAYWAKAMGFPIHRIVLATNANHVISDYLETHHYTPRQSIQTMANAMDVGNPSNFERLQSLFPTFDEFKKEVRAFSVNDEEIKKTIQHIAKRYDYISCPHTATAFYARQQLGDEPYIVVATAHPCKFDELIEPLIHRPVPLAPALETLLHQPTRVTSIAPDLHLIRKAIYDMEERT